MSSETLTYPMDVTLVQRYGIAFRVVLTYIFRGACLVGAIWCLAAVRGNLGPALLGLYLGLALIALYFGLGVRAAKDWAPYVLGFVVFAQLRSYADEAGMPTQFNYPIAMEKALFLGQIPSIWLQDRLYTFATAGPVEIYTMFVYLSYFFIPHIVAVALWKFDRDRFKIYAFAFLGTIYVGLIVSALLPTAPPWMAGQLGYIPHVHQVVPDIFGVVTPGTYQQAYEVAGANDVAAMPSLHSAIPFLMAIALWKYRWFRWPGALYAVSMLFSVAYLGEHYVVDGLAGWAAAGVCWFAVSAFLARSKAGERVNTPVDNALPAPLIPAPGAAIQPSQVTEG
jgi:membrane-associated phospholipid phosphatase